MISVEKRVSLSHTYEYHNPECPELLEEMPNFWKPANKNCHFQGLINHRCECAIISIPRSPWQVVKNMQCFWFPYDFQDFGYRKMGKNFDDTPQIRIGVLLWRLPFLFASRRMKCWTLQPSTWWWLAGNLGICYIVIVWELHSHIPTYHR